MHKDSISRQKADYYQRVLKFRPSHPVYLDKTNDLGLPFYSMVASKTDTFGEIEGSIFREIVGDLSEEDIDYMDENTLNKLRDRLMEAGFQPGVQTKHLL